MSKLIYRSFTQDTKGKVDESGFWDVEIRITETIQREGEEQKTEFISARAVDRVFDEANKVALQSLLHWLDDNVYSKGLDGIVEAAEFVRAYEAAKNANQKTVPDAATEA